MSHANPPSVSEKAKDLKDARATAVPLPDGGWRYTLATPLLTPVLVDGRRVRTHTIEFVVNASGRLSSSSTRLGRYLLGTSVFSYAPVTIDPGNPIPAEDLPFPASR